MRLPSKNVQRGFTMVELVIVMTIVTILSGVLTGLVISLERMKERAQTRVVADEDADKLLRAWRADVKAATSFEVLEKGVLKLRSSGPIVTYGLENGDVTREIQSADRVVVIEDVEELGFERQGRACKIRWVIKRGLSGEVITQNYSGVETPLARDREETR